MVPLEAVGVATVLDLARSRLIFVIGVAGRVVAAVFFSAAARGALALSETGRAAVLALALRPVVFVGMSISGESAATFAAVHQ